MRVDGDTVLSSFSAAVFGVVVVCLFAPVREVGVDSSTAIRARVTATAGEPQGHAARALNWERLQKNDALHAGDTVFTAVGDELGIAFPDGSRLELAPGTLIVLGEKSETVELANGSVTAVASKRPVRIAVGASSGAAVVEGGGEVRVAHGREADLRLEVLAGTALVESTGGSAPTRLAAGKALERSGGRPARMHEIPVALRAPDSDEHVRVAMQGSSAAVVLRWSGSAAGDRIAFARSPAFDVRQGVASVGTASSFSFAPPTPGIWWWRIEDAAGAPRSGERSLVVRVDAPPVPLAPVNDRAIYAPRPGVVRLAWRPLPDVDRYHWEIARDPSFSALESQGDAESSVALVPLPGEGRFYWRVRALDHSYSEAFSTASPFRITSAPVPDAPDDLDATVLLPHADESPTTPSR